MDLMLYDLAWTAMFCFTMGPIHGCIFPVESTHIGRGVNAQILPMVMANAGLDGCMHA